MNNDSMLYWELILMYRYKYTNIGPNGQLSRILIELDSNWFQEL